MGLRFALLHPSKLWLEFEGSTFVFRSVKAANVFLEYKIKSFTVFFLKMYVPLDQLWSKAVALQLD